MPPNFLGRLGEMTMDLVNMFKKYGYTGGYLGMPRSNQSRDSAYSSYCIRPAICLSRCLHLWSRAGGQLALGVQPRFPHARGAAALPGGLNVCAPALHQLHICTLIHCSPIPFSTHKLTHTQDMFDEMCYIVATKHGGSLKGEHGTGRNVASYVEMEWGEYGWLRELGSASSALGLSHADHQLKLALLLLPLSAGTKAYELMWEVKALFDPSGFRERRPLCCSPTFPARAPRLASLLSLSTMPCPDYILNPGVVLNKDPLVHLKHIKASRLSLHPSQ